MPTGVVLRVTFTGKTRDLDVTGLFIAIGHDPRPELFTGHIGLGDESYITVDSPPPAAICPASSPATRHTHTARPSPPPPAAARPRSTPSELHLAALVLHVEPVRLST